MKPQILKCVLNITFKMRHEGLDKLELLDQCNLWQWDEFVISSSLDIVLFINIYFDYHEPLFPKHYAYVAELFFYEGVWNRVMGF